VSASCRKAGSSCSTPTGTAVVMQTPVAEMPTRCIWCSRRCSPSADSSRARRRIARLVALSFSAGRARCWLCERASSDWRRGQGPARIAQSLRCGAVAHVRALGASVTVLAPATRRGSQTLAFHTQGRRSPQLNSRRVTGSANSSTDTRSQPGFADPQGDDELAASPEAAAVILSIPMWCG
jgi:hypothetical protein